MHEFFVVPNLKELLKIKVIHKSIKNYIDLKFRHSDEQNKIFHKFNGL